MNSEIQLIIDSSTYTLNIGLAKDGVVIGEYMTHVKTNHAERVMPAIEQLMQSCNVSPGQLTEIVAGIGPGSYTGVRIGMTVAKTLAWTLKIPIVGVSSLEALAYNVQYFSGLIVPIVDARRKQVFTAVYESDGGTLRVVKQPQLMLVEDLIKELTKSEQPIIVLGTDLAIHGEAFQERLGERVNTNLTHLGSARAANYIACAKHGKRENAHTIVPQYLRLAEAEAKWMETQQKEK
ncbi:MAG: tRNA (adenosine(37)-N6)-threonylcarbamoyltransferase complex dimerization subunit type 1 TsaB [Bacilli bacterium]